MRSFLAKFVQTNYFSHLAWVEPARHNQNERTQSILQWREERKDPLMTRKISV
jgi:hypothetical protein